jgi:hypothetical protein
MLQKHWKAGDKESSCAMVCRPARWRAAPWNPLPPEHLPGRLHMSVLQGQSARQQQYDGSLREGLWISDSATFPLRSNTKPCDQCCMRHNAQSYEPTRSPSMCCSRKAYSVWETMCKAGLPCIISLPLQSRASLKPVHESWRDFATHSGHKPVSTFSSSNARPRVPGATIGPSVSVVLLLLPPLSHRGYSI